ncbi:MAG: NADH-quinone oxidoreductase subunit NuoE [Chloroflexi bacterium]|nr:MAG: NADH-quinone oxidoreductase subunit NuoE [Chloroflexota bacterium]
MLTSAETTEILEEMGHYEQKQAACIEALMVVQRHRGWVPDEALRAVAALLDMTPDELDSVATFYNLIFRQPVGRHVILVCDTVSCWVMGYEEIVAQLGERLGIAFGQTTADGRFTLLPIPCLGACDRAPAMMIDDDLHGPVLAEALDEILARYP